MGFLSNSNMQVIARRVMFDCQGFSFMKIYLKDDKLNEATTGQKIRDA